MSEPKRVEPIKDARSPFVGFLWSEIAVIRQLQRQRYYYEALVYIVDLIDYLPLDFQVTFKFQDKGKETLTKTDNITITQVYNTLQRVERDEKRNKLAKPLLKSFISELCRMLDKKGYMEQKGASIEYGHE